MLYKAYISNKTYITSRDCNNLTYISFSTIIKKIII